MITPDKKFWDVFRNTDGALSCAEALAIIQVAALAPSGVYVEAGTYYADVVYSHFSGYLLG